MKTFIEFLKTKTAILVAILIGLALIAAVKTFQVGGLRIDVDNAQIENARLSDDNSILRNNIIAFSTANAGMLRTINKLEEERADALLAIAALNKAKDQDKAALAKAHSTFAAMMQDPTKNDGTLAPVLRETLRAVKELDKK